MVGVVAALAVVVARPAATAPILGADGNVLPGSVAELTTAKIGGHDRVLMIRGRSTDLPVLLHLAGGPGGTDIGAMRLDTGLEERFVVVTWDQRATGKSYPAFAPAETLMLEQVVADTIELSELLAARFGHERIYLAGQSWGTIPATLVAQRRPDLNHALIGTGQMVDIRETDRLFYADTLAWARERGDAELVDPYARLYPQLQELDLRAEVPTLEVPVWVVMGRHEARGRVEPAQEWFEALRAPAKHWVVFEGSSHRANTERPAAYAALLDEVVAATAGR